jgi:hypothetical protein
MRRTDDVVPATTRLSALGLAAARVAEAGMNVVLLEASDDYRQSTASGLIIRTVDPQSARPVFRSERGLDGYE